MRRARCLLSVSTGELVFFARAIRRRPRDSVLEFLHRHRAKSAVRQLDVVTLERRSVVRDPRPVVAAGVSELLVDFSPSLDPLLPAFDEARFERLALGKGATEVPAFNVRSRRNQFALGPIVAEFGLATCRSSSCQATTALPPKGSSLFGPPFPRTHRRGVRLEAGGGRPREPRWCFCIRRLAGNELMPQGPDARWHHGC